VASNLEGSCEYIEEVFAESWHGVVFHFAISVKAVFIARLKIGVLRKVSYDIALP
jgi:hypothetical protein